MTTDGTVPKCSGTQQARRLSLTLVDTTVIMAVSCNGDMQSGVVTQQFEVVPGPVVMVTFKIEGSMSAADLTDDMKNAFVDALVEVLSISSRERIQDVSVKDARRRLLALDLSMGILTNGDPAAASLQDNINSADFGSLGVRAGWIGASVGGVEVSVINPDGTTQTPATAPEEKEGSSVMIIVAGALGAVLGLTVVGAGTFYLHRRSVAKMDLAAKEAQSSSLTPREDPLDLAAVHADIIDEDQSVADSHVDRAFGTGGMNLEERIMRRDDDEVDSTLEAGAIDDEDQETSPHKVGATRDMARGEFVFVNNVADALGLFNLHLPWQEGTEEKPAHAEVPAMSSASSATQKLSKYKQNMAPSVSHDPADLAGPPSIRALPASMTSASTPSVVSRRPQEMGAAGAGPETPPSSDDEGGGDGAEAEVAAAGLSSRIPSVNQEFPRYPRVVSPRPGREGIVEIAQSAPVQQYDANCFTGDNKEHGYGN